jgi:glycosyltransferase involved in cell wall biosynthesis
VRGRQSPMRQQSWRQPCAQAKHVALVLRQLACRSVEIIPNAVDLQQFSPTLRDDTLAREFAIRNDDIVVAHISNMKPMKRPLDIINSAERALQQDSRLLYLMVGDGPCRASIEETCQEKRISNRFRFGVDRLRSRPRVHQPRGHRDHAIRIRVPSASLSRNAGLCSRPAGQRHPRGPRRASCSARGISRI